jgi:rRNA maturation endonuclease Nob1
VQTVTEYFNNWRNLKGLKQCIRCGKEFTDEPHHFYCNDCWIWKKLDRAAREIDAEVNTVIRKRMYGTG